MPAMMIDENKVIAKSKSYTNGYKGMRPSFKKGHTSNGRALRIVVGVSLTAGFAAGLIALVYTLLTEGGSAVTRIAKQKQAPQYVEVTFKPKQPAK